MGGRAKLTLRDKRKVNCSDCYKVIGVYDGEGVITGMCKECYERTAKCKSNDLNNLNPTFPDIPNKKYKFKLTLGE